MFNNIKSNMAYIGRNKKESVLPLIGMTIGALLFTKGVILLAAILIKPAILVATGTTLSVMAPVLVGIIAVAALFTWFSGKIIGQNREIFEMNAPKIIVVRHGYIHLQVTTETLDNIVKNYPNKNAEGEVIENEFRLDFTNQEGEELYIIGSIGSHFYCGSKVLLEIKSLMVKEGGKYSNLQGDKRLEKLGLGTGENDKKELIVTLSPPKSAIKEAEAKEAQGEERKK